MAQIEQAESRVISLILPTDKHGNLVRYRDQNRGNIFHRLDAWIEQHIWQILGGIVLVVAASMLMGVM